MKFYRLNSILILLCLITTFFIFGCISNTRWADVTIRSEPQGARIYQGDKFLGTAPVRKIWKIDTKNITETNPALMLDLGVFFAYLDGYERTQKEIRLGIQEGNIGHSYTESGIGYADFYYKLDELIILSKKEINHLPPQVYESTKPSSLVKNEVQEIEQYNKEHRKGLAHKWAVVIGISNYPQNEKKGLTNLIFADDDAKSFASVLRRLGMNSSHIKLLVNEKATQRNIMIAMESWLTKAGPNDTIILYWAGHGFPDPEDPEKVYFACYDTDLRIPATGYRMDRVRSVLEEHRAKNVIVFADTCHAGKLITRGDRGLSIVPNIEKMSREQKVPKGWIFMVGADTDRQAIEDTSWANGAFTHSLIKGLSGEADGFQSAGAKDGVVTMGELKDYMNTAMPNETQKVLGVAKRPVITTSTGDPDIWNLTLQVK